MSGRTRSAKMSFGFLALPMVLAAACDPGGQEQAPSGDADAAEAPPIQRPTTAPDFSEWDEEGDLALNPDEFGAWAEDQGIFEGWFDNGVVDLAAVEEEIHSSIDVSGEGRVDENDWNAVTEQMRKLFAGEYPGDWSEWDADGDGELSIEEFRREAAERNLREHMDVDGDGQVTRRDVRDYYFRLLDENRDGLVDLAEWNANLSAWVDFPM